MLLRQFILLLSLTLTSYVFANETLVPVSGFARSFPYNNPIEGAKIKVLETGQIVKTDAAGKFTLNYPVGKEITLIFKKRGYKTTQSATVTVPPEGLTGPDRNFSFQIATSFIFKAYSRLIGAEIDRNSCHMAATITAKGKTLLNVKQGEVGATVSLSPAIDAKPFYFDTFLSGPLKDYTNPITRTLTSVSYDGGAAYINLPPRPEPYTLRAHKDGVVFSEAKFICRRGVFVNMSPPFGPRVQG